MASCIDCNRVLKKPNIKYCLNKCQREKEYKLYILRWKNGGVSGQRGVEAKNISGHIRRYLINKYAYACSQCGSNKINIEAGLNPLEVDRVDSDSENNLEANIRILCPNCHSLASSYRNLNKGHGRPWRRINYPKAA
jgi:5-methylcytosine-specific restriction endonuclease McrA